MSEHPQDQQNRANEEEKTDKIEPATGGANHSEWDEKTRPLDPDAFAEESIETAKIEDLSSEEPLDSPTEPLSGADVGISPFDIKEYDIVEPPEDDDEETGFARIPLGPTEEVDYDEPRQRRPRRERKPRRAPRTSAVRAKPVSVTAKPGRIPVAVIVAAVAVIIILVALIVWLAGRPKDEAPSSTGLDVPAATEGPSTEGQ